MKTLHKYLTGQVLASLLLTAAVFTFVLLLGNILKEILEFLVSGQVSFTLILQAIGLLIPWVWVFALPMALLTATLLVFGRFSADQELTAARASGVSLLSLITPILLLSLFCCCLSAWINLDLGPRSRVAYLVLKEQLRAELMSGQLPEGRFIPISTNYVFYAEKNRGGKLEDVMILVLENTTNISMTITAPTGNLVINPTNKEMFLQLMQSRFLTRRGAITSIDVWTSPNLYPTNESASREYRAPVNDMTFRQLREKLRDREHALDLLFAVPTSPDEAKNNFIEPIRIKMEREISAIRVAMHREVAFSFACFGFTLVGIPLGIRMHRRETNVGIAMALVLVLIYYSFIIAAGSLSARPELAPHLILWLPNFIFQAVGAVLLWRANRGI
ncbi:MAG: LptF/LptG family permease [Limisphaerales bacterium]